MLVKQEKKKTLERRTSGELITFDWALKLSLAACFLLTGRARSLAPEARDPIRRVH